VRDVGVGVAAADPALELKNFRDGVVELPSFGVPVFDDFRVSGCGVRASSVGWNSASRASAISRSRRA
jgi:hypothetical protein